MGARRTAKISSVRGERWIPDSNFPMATAIFDHLHKNRLKRQVMRPEIVSEELGVHVMQRLAPFLRRNAPTDILDLWPGCGLFSSKVNEFLRPRRHVMLEPDLKLWQKFLEPLTEAGEGYKLLDTNPRSFSAWDELLKEHFPEQGPENADTSGALPCNSNLLVVANLTRPPSPKDHMTTTRWISSFMEACLWQKGLHSYGAVRLLAVLPQDDSSGVIPHEPGDRKRAAILTENVALHNVTVATHDELCFWANVKGVKYAEEERIRVTEQASANGFLPIPGREPSPITPTPDFSHLSRDPEKHRYEPRIRSELHSQLLEEIERIDKMSPSSPDYKAARKVRGRAITRINSEHRANGLNRLIVEKLMQLDELYKSVARLAARPTTTRADFEPLLSEIASLKQVIDADYKKVQTKWRPSLRHTLDDMRSRASDDRAALLHWDRRPFEPLRMQDNETYPRDEKRSILYFEPDPNSPVARKLFSLDPATRATAADLFEILTLSLYRGRTDLTLGEMLPLVFPGRSINDCVRAIPGLVQHTVRTPKPDFDALPKTLIAEPSAGAGAGAADNNGAAAQQQLDPAMCFQENLDYDVSDVRVHIIPCPVLWDICIEYSHYEHRQSIRSLARALGATLTGSRLGAHLTKGKRLN
ncbi:uncharacterized protein BO95DRAFT_366770 [Aspergillus brunneoviolaceus CBS 621.78]|uniref:Uncharacterized protein n=1 Tax=Aspergillus brunneoviolaceus CBS 621.78 TaxID=1450534 RepID=A0ACD1G4U6_9EURO|nr:hypothetical protein BO95DRAFT_366770 [Aspergillus brunneoviolaceus CBS 621.78]RAH44176.1 hypothetical protein BO95DRAFT_366770 [Aspergillus brunneoviolaceus CBS 621.78]